MGKRIYTNSFNVKHKTWKFDQKSPATQGIRLRISVAGHFNMNYFSAMLGVLFGLEKTET
jgi:hypothetical protein